MNKHVIHVLVAAIAVGFPLMAIAHSGHVWNGFLDGLVHPYEGGDHLLAMLVVGVWGGLCLTRAWLAPLCFVCMLSVGGMLGQVNQGAFSMTEPLVALSLLSLGLMLCDRHLVGNPVALVIIGFFALFHGLAHGNDLPAIRGALVGMIFGSFVLHALGIALAHYVLRRRPRLVRYFGQAVAFVGGGLLITAIA